MHYIGDKFVVLEIGEGQLMDVAQNNRWCRSRQQMGGLSSEPYRILDIGGSWYLISSQLLGHGGYFGCELYLVRE